MADQSPSEAPPSAPTKEVVSPVPVEPAAPRQNPNLIIAGVALAAFLGVVLVGLSLKQKSGKAAEADRLRAEIATLQMKSGSGSGAATGLITRIDQDVDQLRTLVTTFDATRASMQQELDSSRGTRETLTQDIARLRSELAAAQSSSQNSEQLASQLESARALLENSQAQLQELRSKPDLTQDLLQATQLNDLQKKRIAELEGQMEGSVSAERMDGLRNQLAEFKRENEDLKNRLRKAERQLARTRLYVEDADQLDAAVAALFSELRGLEDVKSLDSAYADLSDSQSAKLIDTLAFPTGSADLDTTGYGQVARDVSTANDNANFLVVGYASQSGDLAANRELSAKRATGVASVIDSVLKPGQSVQAVFLGETDRFSSDAEGPNQICEIWEVVPR